MSEGQEDFTVRDDSSDSDSLIDEQAHVLNILRRERLLQMIARTKKEIDQRLNNPENSSGAIVEAIQRVPDKMVDSLRKRGASSSLPMGTTQSSQKRSCCF